MKTTKKFFTYGLLVLSIVFTSCAKDGDIGPIGPEGSQGIAGTNGVDGTDGTDGTNGTDGVDGNANIRIIEYGLKTFTGSTTYVMQNVSQADVNNHLFLAYYGREFTVITPSGGILNKTQWLSVPGRGHGSFNTSSVIETTSTSFTSADYIVALYNLNGSDYTIESTFQKFKIFVVPPSSLSGKSSRSDLSKMPYKEIIAYLGLPE